MNETLKTIAERHTCRDFKDTPLTDEQVSALVDAALASPSGMNSQPWHISVITNKAIVDDMDAAGVEFMAAQEDKAYYHRIMDRGGKLFYNAPCMIVISTDGSTWASLDSGIMCQNISLAAHSLGLGSCIVGLLRMPMSSARADEFRALLKFPEGYDYIIGVLVGTANSGKEPHELMKSKVTYIN